MPFRGTDFESDTGRDLGVWGRRVAAVIGAGVALAVSSVGAQQRGNGVTAQRPRPSPVSADRHTHPLQAVQLLEYRPAGADARVRFEWDQVSGARAYRLVGRWTGAVSWTVRTREYDVTARNATTWTSGHVTFEVPLPLGNHSWRLLAAVGPNELRAVGDSTPLSFAVK